MKRNLGILIAVVMCAVIAYAAPVMTSGFETGADSKQWNFINTTFDTSNPLSGNRSLRINPSMTQQYAFTKSQFGAGIMVARVRTRFATLPNTPSYILSNLSAGALFRDGQIYAASSSGWGATGVAVQTGVIYVIDMKVDMSVSPWLVDVQVNGVACGQFQQPSPAFTGAKNLRIGSLNLYAMDAVFDDVALSVTAADYPLGF